MISTISYIINANRNSSAASRAGPPPPIPEGAAGKKTLPPADDIYRCQFDFTSDNPDDLHMKEGDVIQVTIDDNADFSNGISFHFILYYIFYYLIPFVQVLETDDSGWWTGTRNGKTGFFPGNYVKKL